MLKFISFNDIAMKALDGIYRILPQRKPDRSKLTSVKLVAHRGCHEPNDCIENSLRAFELALENRIWGIEFDVRWTRDEVPILSHDPDLFRLFNLSDCRVTDLDYEELKKRAPEILPLSQVLERYGKRLHLMIELKEVLDSSQKIQTLKNLLSPLTPVEDFHILSLNPSVFENLSFLPSACFLPVAEWNLKHLSKMALEKAWGGVTGHYFLLNNSLKAQHAQAGQKVGTGFANSKNLLYRELNRGIDWIFTDKALAVKALLDKALKS